MSSSVRSIAGHQVLVFDADGPLLRTEDDARDVIQETFGTGIRWAVIPVERLDPDFFVLRTGVAGAFVQKIVQYRIRLIVLGDISEHRAASEALSDWEREVNRGPDLWFLPSWEALEERMNVEKPGS